MRGRRVGAKVIVLAIFLMLLCVSVFACAKNPAGKLTFEEFCVYAESTLNGYGLSINDLIAVKKADGSPSMPNNAGSPSQAGTDFLSWGAADMGVPSYLGCLAPQYSSNTLRSVVVAVCDTGVDASHPFLQGRIASGGRNYSKVLYPIIDVNKWDTNTNDGDGHGTHVSGTIVDLTLPNVKILPIKILDDEGTGSAMSLYYGLQYVNSLKTGSTPNIYAINMSVGMTVTKTGVSLVDNIIDNCIAYISDLTQTIVTCAASGNEEHLVSGSADTTSPANISGVLTVGAVDESHSHAYFSNTGACVDIVGPGVNVLSSVPYDIYGEYYIEYNGTSMATPHVTAAVALLYSDATKSPTVTSVKNNLTSNATDLGVKGRDNTYGYGFVNLEPLVPKITWSPTLSLSEGTCFTSYNATFSAAACTGFVVTYSLKSGSTLPDGLLFSPSERKISGTVSAAAGDFTFTVVASSTNLQTAEKTFTLKVNKAVQSVEGEFSVIDKTENAITVTDMGIGAEYSIDGTSWQATNVFSNLTKDVEYTFYVRKKETAFYLVSATVSTTGTIVSPPPVVEPPEEPSEPPTEPEVPEEPSEPPTEPEVPEVPPEETEALETPPTTTEPQPNAFKEFLKDKKKVTFAVVVTATGGTFLMGLISFIPKKPKKKKP